MGLEGLIHAGVQQQSCKEGGGPTFKWPHILLGFPYSRSRRIHFRSLCRLSVPLNITKILKFDLLKGWKKLHSLPLGAPVSVFNTTHCLKAVMDDSFGCTCDEKVLNKSLFKSVYMLVYIISTGCIANAQ